MTVSPTGEAAARAALRERLGLGARYDAPEAPARELEWARRGAAYFARRLNALGDAELDRPSRLPGITRRALVARIGHQARAFVRIAEAARNGTGREALGDPDQPPDDEALAATLPARALRFLFDHSQAHLNVEWRDLAGGAWDVGVETLDGRRVSPRATVAARASAIWLHAVDLGDGGSLDDIPKALTEAMRASGAEAGIPEDPTA